MAATNFDAILTELKDVKAAIADAKKPAEFVNRGAPHVTTGAVYQDSKPFSLYSFIHKGMVKNDPDQCKHELDTLSRFKKALQATGCMLADSSSGWWLPVNIDSFGPQLTSNSASEEDVKFVKAVMGATRPYIDPDEEARMNRSGMFFKAQSAFTDSTGGSLVAPPQMGEVIPLIRPTAACLAAGASSVTLPPQGRLVRPRITGAPGAQAIQEGGTIASSNLTTGQMVMTAKKIGGAVTLSKESSQYTSGSMDRYAQDELNRTLGLKFDNYAFYGAGGTLYPAGITSSEYVGTNGVLDVFGTYTSARGIGTDGNTLLPEYGDMIPALIQERSFAMDGDGGKWIMRPLALASVRSARASTITAGDKQGQFVDIMRKFQEKGSETWTGTNVVKTTNVSNTGTKGNGTALSDAFYGIWKHLIIATYGAIQFDTGHDGSTFLNDQYIVKGTMYGDVGVEYPGAFAWCKQLASSLGVL